MTRSEAAAVTLRKFMEQHTLTQRDIATLACVHIKTVEGWLADPDAASFRKMPPRHISVIRVMLPGFLAKRKSIKGKTK